MNELLRQILDFGMADILNKDSHWKADDFCVAAGDPVSESKNCGGHIKLVEHDEASNGDRLFVICGNSMSPKGIDDGDNLFGRKFNLGVDTIYEGDFLILKVDPDYYNGKTPNYDHKLRCAIMTVPKDWAEKRIIDEMKKMDSQPEIWLSSYQKCLHEKLEKARNHYKNKDLILSCTYKNGNLRYSFHDLDYIEYRVIAQIKRKGDKSIIDLKRAA